MESKRLHYPCLITPPGTPAHLVGAKFFETDEECKAFHAKPEWRHLIRCNALNVSNWPKTNKEAE